MVKFLLVVAVSFLFSGLSYAENRSVCFQADDETKARILIRENRFVTVKWDMNSNARSSEEHGHLQRLTENGDEISFVTYLQGVGDGSNFRITVGPAQVTFQSLWSNGTNAGEPSVFSVVSCSECGDTLSSGSSGK